ncbi:radical SAM protein [Patescibacteria group bacterium]|nr:radical SAM protein [Patescibacteria group bacterium]
MKAKIKPRIDLENRTKLETVIPLCVPFIIFVDPSDLCNFRCKFCPSGDMALMKKIGRSLQVMNFELYKKIIDDICEFEKPIKVLRLYKDGEPLLNPHFAEMVRYAKEKKCAERVDTTTNASLLNPKINLEIIEAGLDRINISIEGVNAEQYLEFSNYTINFDKLVENIRHLYENRKNCEIIIKIPGDNLSENDKEKFYEIFGEMADGVSIEHTMSCWPEFDLKGIEVNQEFGIYGQKIKEVQVCPYVFYSFSINSDGLASLCFLDWSRKLIIGDAKNESVIDIWNGKKLLEYQKMFLRKERKKHLFCGECGQMSHGLPDDIDNYAGELLKRIEK